MSLGQFKQFENEHTRAKVTNKLFDELDVDCLVNRVCVPRCLEDLCCQSSVNTNASS